MRFLPDVGNVVKCGFCRGDFTYTAKMRSNCHIGDYCSNQCRIKAMKKLQRKKGLKTQAIQKMKDAGYL